MRTHADSGEINTAALAARGRGGHALRNGRSGTCPTPRPGLDFYRGLLGKRVAILDEASLRLASIGTD